MFGSRKSLVYCSKDREDWEKARGLLAEAGIDITARNVEEPPVGGCGAKIDARSFLSGNGFSFRSLLCGKCLFFRCSLCSERFSLRLLLLFTKLSFGFF